MADAVAALLLLLLLLLAAALWIGLAELMMWKACRPKYIYTQDILPVLPHISKQTNRHYLNTDTVDKNQHQQQQHDQNTFTTAIITATAATSSVTVSAARSGNNSSSSNGNRSNSINHYQWASFY